MNGEGKNRVGRSGIIWNKMRWKTMAGEDLMKIVINNRDIQFNNPSLLFLPIFQIISYRNTIMARSLLFLIESTQNFKNYYSKKTKDISNLMPINVLLLTKKKTFLRLDVLPFIPIYLSFFIFAFEEEVYTKLLFIAVALLNCIAYLMNFWSVRANTFIEYHQILLNAQQMIPNEKILKIASNVRVASEKKGRNSIYAICPLEQQKIGDELIYFFHFHNKKYLWDSNKKIFYRIKPCLNHPIKYYQKNEKPDNSELIHYDKNKYEIPIPEFKKLLKDQLIEPFSFFQFFSVALWLMDEGRFYSLLTLFMIFMSSCVVAIQRMRTMFMLKKMQVAPQYIYVYENHKWVKINSDELKPGDICAIQTSSSIKIIESALQNQNNFQKLLPFPGMVPPKMQQNMAQQAQQKEPEENHKILPCDFLLLSGSCIVNEAILTGESIPQIKDSIENIDNDQTNLDIKNKHKINVLFGGTEVIQVFQSDYLPPHVHYKPPANCCLAYVLRTGFNTTKGKLTRTVLFNNENMNIKQSEAFILIFILLIFSIWSSANILITGLEDPDRDKNKLFLRCILIITTVVPPELPMILTMAVNSSLLYLQRKRIFCTEPFRIPVAGKVNICAFDKTGTLTSDDLIFRGVVDSLNSEEEFKTIKLKENLDENTQTILAGCHSLVSNQGKLLGDPIEKAIFDTNNWKYSNLDKIAHFEDKKLHIMTLYPFSAELRRMSSVISYTRKDVFKDFRVVAKGAPEAMETLYVKIPENYEEVYRYYAKRGYRVLALGFKILPADIDKLTFKREEAEKDLIFAGFILFDSPLKKDTQKQINLLKNANFKNIIVTGDSELTAASISRELKLGASDNYLFLETHGNEVYWQDDNNKKYCDLNPKHLNDLSSKHTLCIKGRLLEYISNHFSISEIKQIINHCIVFSRVSPSQKEYIIFSLRSSNHKVLMCGDGTNDVGALKKADVGLALVGLDDKSIQDKKEQKRKQNRQNPNPQDTFLVFGDMPSYKPGDASIAAPFTSKHSNSTKCVLIVLKQGICTLVTTFQTYRILSMSCLISAYSMSALHMQKTKFSETQSTILGILGAANYYFYSNTKPLKVLSKTRPPTTIFEPYFILSVLGQVGIQLYFMDQIVHNVALKYSLEEEIKMIDDEEFKPTFINTTVFLYNMVGQTCIFLFNYGGRPFMESLSDNKKYLKILLISLFVTFLLATNGSEELSYAFDLSFKVKSQEVMFSFTMNFKSN